MENFAQAKTKLGFDWISKVKEEQGEGKGKVEGVRGRALYLPYCGVAPAIVEVIAYATEFLSGWVRMEAEVDHRLEHLGAAVALFRVAGE